MLKGKIYFKSNKNGTTSATINITGNLQEIRLDPRMDLFVKVEADGRKLTMIPMNDVTI